MFSNKHQSLGGCGNKSCCLVLITTLMMFAIGAADAAVRHVNPNRLDCPENPYDPNLNFVDSGIPGANGVMVYCTIKGALDNAVADDTIYIAPNPKTYPESLVLNDATNRSLTIIGSGTAHTIIDSSTRAFLVREDVTIKQLTMDSIGPPKSGIGGGMNLFGNIVVNLEDVVIKNGEASLGGGISIESGQLNMQRVAVINNKAIVDPADTNRSPPAGGGIYVGPPGTLTAIDSTISGNHSQPLNNEGGYAAGIYNLGTATLINTTLSGNVANATNKEGGGITNGDSNNSAVLNLYNVTLANNTAISDGGGVYNFNGTVNVRNSIIADNTDNGTSPNCGANSSNIFNSLDYNIIGCNATVFPPATNDIEVLPTTTLNLVPIPTFAPTDEFYGLPVFLAHNLDLGSIAIDNVGINSCLDQNNNSLASDQRGVARPFDGDNNGTSTCDAGAVEAAEDIIVYPTELITFEDQGTSSFYVVLTRPPAAAQTVQLDIASQMIAEGTVSPGVVSFDDTDWNIPKTVQINVQNDGVEDGDQTYTVNVSTGDINVATKQVTITNIDTVIPPDLVVTPTSIEVTEGGPAEILGVRLATPPAAGSLVHVKIANDLGNGVNSEEVLSIEDLNFNDANWRIPQEVTVSAFDDTVPDGSVSYNLTVTVQADSTDTAFIGKTASIPITVHDNEPLTGNAGVSFPGIPSTLTTTEDGGEVTFNVVLNSAPGADVTVNLVSNAADEGLFLNAQTLQQQQELNLTFTQQNWNLPQAVTVVGVDDEFADGGKNYYIFLVTISNDTSYDGLDIPDIRITNNDNDNPAILVSQSSGLVTNESGTSTTFQVQLSAPPVPTTQVVLTAEVQPPGSGLPMEGSVTLPPNQLVFDSSNYNQPQPVTVTGLDDCAADGDISYEITITTNSVSTTSPPYKTFAQAQTVTITNQDNDTSAAAQIVISKTQLQTSENLTSDAFDVCLTTQPTDPVTITMDIPAGFADEGLFSSGQATQEITFDQTNWAQPQTVRIAGQDDTAEDGDQVYQIDIAPAVSVDTTYSNMIVPAVTVTNADNDTGVIITPNPPGLEFYPDPDPETFITSESGDSFSIDIRPTTEPNGTVNVKITIPEEFRSEGRIQDSAFNQLFEKTLVFTTSNWKIQQSVTIIGVDDSVIDDNVFYNININTSQSSAPEYQDINLPQIKVINVDNDNDRVKPNSPDSGGGALNPALLWLLCALLWMCRHRWAVNSTLGH